MKGTWRKGFLAGDREGYVEKALETGISFHRGPVWGTWGRARLPGTENPGLKLAFLWVITPLGDISTY